MRPLVLTLAALHLASAAAAQGNIDWSAAPPLGATTPFTPPTLDRRLLPNGLRVLSVTRPGAPLARRCPPPSR